MATVTERELVAIVTLYIERIGIVYRVTVTIGRGVPQAQAVTRLKGFAAQHDFLSTRFQIPLTNRAVMDPLLGHRSEQA